MKKFDNNKREAPKKEFVADVVDAAIGIGITLVVLRLVGKVLTAAVTPPRPTVYYVVSPSAPQQTPAE